MLNKDYTTKIFNLEDVKIANVKSEIESIHVYLELPRKEHRCPGCGATTSLVHDYREQVVKDVPLGRATCLHLRKRRYRCPECGKRFAEDNVFLPRYRRMTNRLIASIIDAFHKVISAVEIAPSTMFPFPQPCASLTAFLISAMRATSSQQGRVLLHLWLKSLHAVDLPESNDCEKACRNWFQDILSSFDVPWTNGFTDGCNNKTKVLKRVCYGVRNFDRFHNRILHCAS